MLQLHHLLQNKSALGWYNAQHVEVLSTFCSKLQQSDLLQDRFDSWVACMAGIKRGREGGIWVHEGQRILKGMLNKTMVSCRHSFPFSLAHSAHALVHPYSPLPFLHLPCRLIHAW